MPTNFEISLNPTSANGDILTSNGSSRIRFATSTTANQILTAVSSAASGLEWRTYGGAATGAAFAVISSVLSATSTITISNIPSTYTDLSISITDVPGGGNSVNLQINSNATSVYSQTGMQKTGSAATTPKQWHYRNGTVFIGGYNFNAGTHGTTITYYIQNYASTSLYKPIYGHGACAGVLSGSYDPGSYTVNQTYGTFRSTSAVTSVTISGLTSSPYTPRVYLRGILRA